MELAHQEKLAQEEYEMHLKEEKLRTEIAAKEREEEDKLYQAEHDALKQSEHDQFLIEQVNVVNRLQPTQPTSGGSVTAAQVAVQIVPNFPAPSNGDPIYRFLCMPAMRSGFVISAINKYMSESRYA